MNISIPKITTKHLLLDLIDSKNLSNAGPGGAAFQQAIQNMNSSNTSAAIQNFSEALQLGLDPLRQGYAYANIGELYVKNNDLENAIPQFIKVFELNQVLYESAHLASEYLMVIFKDLGRVDEATALERLATRTRAKLGHSMSPDMIAKLHQMVSQLDPQPSQIPPEGEAGTPMQPMTTTFNETLFNLRPLHQMKPSGNVINEETVDISGDTFDPESI
jgi:tetratricopeptide (TPR) repeat protein